MLEVKHITKSFGGVEAIRGSEFVVQKNKITALIGPNGAGKTTLFDIICGFVQPDAGSVFFKGIDISKLEPFERANLGISRTFQQVRLFRYLRIFDHLQMIRDNADTHLVKNIFGSDTPDLPAMKKLLEEFGIEHEPKTLVSELSYGQRKLLHIAMALHKKHDMLMLDEPVAGVNKVLQARIEQMLLGLKEKGETILLIDHDMQFIRRLADHVIVLDAGVVLTQGNPEEVLKDKRVLEAYLGE